MNLETAGFIENAAAEHITGIERGTCVPSAALTSRAASGTLAEANMAQVEKIAAAVLYEGYLLYPYRPSSVKNRQRFNFGVLYPDGFDVSTMRTEWIVTRDQPTNADAHAEPAPSVDIKFRFLQLAERDNWQEGHERELTIFNFLLDPPRTEVQAFRFFSIPFGDTTQAPRFEPIDGEIEITSSRVDADPDSCGVFQLSIEIRNTASGSPGLSRDEALLRSLISTHIIGSASNGAFVSLVDPPEPFREAVTGCSNVGAWPVLAGEPASGNLAQNEAAGDQATNNGENSSGLSTLILSSPIILYDYPQIAPESPGDLFDATEIDEILALRILTMTDDEKAEMRHADDRARRILERTESLPPERFAKLHGALRGLNK